MITKSPSQCDGKPVNTPTDIVPAWKAGVTFGPDQIERDAEARRQQKRARRAASKARHRANVAAGTPEDREAWKRRRNRADNMTRALRRGTPIPNVANYWSVTSDDVLAEVKWLSGFRNRHRARHRSSDAKTYPLLPQRKPVGRGQEP